MTSIDKILRGSGSKSRRAYWLTATAIAGLALGSGPLLAQTSAGGASQSSSVIVNEEVLESLGSGAPYVPPLAIIQRPTPAPDERAQPTASIQAVRITQPSVIVNESALPEPASGRGHRTSPAPAGTATPGVPLPTGVQPNGIAGSGELLVTRPAELPSPPTGYPRSEPSAPAPASETAALPPAKEIAPPTASAAPAKMVGVARPITPEAVAAEPEPAVPVAPEPVAPAPALPKPAVAKTAPDLAVRQKPVPAPEVTAESAPESKSTAAAEAQTAPPAPVPMAKPAAQVQDTLDQPVTAALAAPEPVVAPVQDIPDQPVAAALAAPEPVVASVQDMPDEPESAALAAPKPAAAPVQDAPEQSATVVPAERLSASQSAALTPDLGVAPGDGARVLFAAGSAELSEAGKRALAALADRITADSALGIQLLAYADGPREGDSRARRLSLSRALVVRAFLIERGIRATRMDVRALGNKTDQGPSDRVDILPEG